MKGICDPLAGPSDGTYQYVEYSDDRTTAVKILKSDVKQDYIVRGVLGQGNYGLVKEGVHCETLRKVALKFVDSESLSERDEKLFLMEAGILTGLAHGNIVEMYGLYKGDHAYCLVLEHMGGGELFDDILRRNFYTEACARRVVLQVLDALAFLHRRGIIHRDVKPENLLLPRAGSGDVKLADFGFATVLVPPTYQAVDPVGTPGYAAPEVLRLLPYDGRVDVFSVGVIAFVLLAGHLPFEGASVREVVMKTLWGKASFDEVQWAARSKDAKDFVKSLISVSPSARPGADEALSHPWMKASGEHLRSFPVSNDSFKGMLDKFQNQHQTTKQKMKAAVGAVLAANRFRENLETGNGLEIQQIPQNGQKGTESLTSNAAPGAKEIDKTEVAFA